mgnify:CR=1 FL=1
MLQYFFAQTVSAKPTKGLFDDLAIAKHPDCMAHQGKSPVISLTLKGVKGLDFESAITALYEQVRRAYENHRYLVDSNKLSEQEKKIIFRHLEKNASINELKESISTLSLFIHKHSGKKAYLMIDEYDTAIQEAYLHHYYETMISFMRSFLSSSLKDNTAIKKAILTGILRISKESLFFQLFAN